MAFGDFKCFNNSLIQYKGKDTTVHVPYGVKCIESYSFCDKSVKQIILPESVDRIMQNSFCRCQHLVEIVFPKKVIHMDKHAIHSCHNIKSITLPEGITGFDFEECLGLETVYLPSTFSQMYFYRRNAHRLKLNFNQDNCNYRIVDDFILDRHSTYLIAYIGEQANVIVPQGISVICEGAFARTKIETVVIPSGITEIKNYAFDSCIFLKNISIPETVILLGQNAFSNCISLKEFKIPGSV